MFRTPAFAALLLASAVPAHAQDFGATGGRTFSVDLGVGAALRPAYPGAEDAEVAHALIVSAEDWLRGQGMNRALGPLSISIWDEPGLLVEGFDTPPTIMLGHNSPLYRAWIEDAGYRPVKRLINYGVPITNGFPPIVDRIVAAHNRTLFEVPVGFKWFVPGLLDSTLAFGGEESAGGVAAAEEEEDGIATYRRRRRAVCFTRARSSGNKSTAGRRAARRRAARVFTERGK